MSETIEVQDQGRVIAFSFADMMSYHGPGSPGGVAHAFKVLELALPALSPGGAAERREIHIRTAFGGPGARDSFELVTRAVTGGRYTVESVWQRPELGRTRERFVFRLGYRGREVTLVLREGYVTDEFLDLARQETRDAGEEERLSALKLEMTDRVMSAAAGEVYDIEAAP